MGTCNGYMIQVSKGAQEENPLSAGDQPILLTLLCNGRLTQHWLI